MPTGGPPDPDGPDVPRVQGSGPTGTDRALGALLDDWRREDPEGYAAFMRGDHTRVRLADSGTAPGRPYRQGSSLRLTRPRTRVALLLAALVLMTSISPLPRMALGVVDTLTYSPTEPVTTAPQPLGGGRLAPIVPVGGAPPADEYAFMETQPGTGEPVRFDPCRPIHYVVREHGMGPEAVDVVHDAVARVSAATGLVFVYDGLTDEAPSPNRDARGRDGSGYAPVLVAWTDPSEVPRLEDTIAGVGGPTSVRGPDGRRTFVTGEVSLDGPQLAPELTVLERWSVTAVVMHELGHLVGADHPADASQLMAAEHRGQRDWGDGDRYALAVLGQGRCG
jgi:hypothetical protein